MHLAAPTRNSGHGGRRAIAINPIQNYPTKADPEGFETGMLQPSSMPQTHFSSFIVWSTRHTNFPRRKGTDFTTKGRRRQFTSGIAGNCDDTMAAVERRARRQGAAPQLGDGARRSDTTRKTLKPIGAPAP